MREAHVSGVPAFDLSQPCAMTPGGQPLATQCPRCKNPHHKCDMGNPAGVATPFSDFIRNASPEEKAKVYGEVMDRVSEQQRAVISGVAPARRFTGVGELERTGYIPPGSADERERRTSGVLALADPRDLLSSALDDLRRAVAFQDQVREAAKNGEEVTGTGIARDAREWVDRAAREVVEAAHGVRANRAEPFSHQTPMEDTSSGKTVGER